MLGSQKILRICCTVGWRPSYSSTRTTSNVWALSACPPCIAYYLVKRKKCSSYYDKIRGLLQTQATPLQVSLLLIGRFHAGHSLVLDKCALVLVPHSPRGRTEKHSIPRGRSIIPFFPIRTCLQRHVKPFYIQPYPISYALLGSQGNTITLAHPVSPRATIEVSLFVSRFRPFFCFRNDETP